MKELTVKYQSPHKLRNAGGLHLSQLSAQVQVLVPCVYSLLVSGIASNGQLPVSRTNVYARYMSWIAQSICKDKATRDAGWKITIL